MISLNRFRTMALASLLAFAFLIAASPATAGQEEEVYIVHVAKRPESDGQDSLSLESFYGSFVKKQDGLVHSYRHVASGFAARLTAEEAEDLARNDGVRSVRKQRTLSLHTTHTPTFLGLNQNLGFVNGSRFGDGVIIGVLDTGIFPAHPSFGDAGMSPIPAKWKGKCDFGDGVCNKKLIGARNFVTGSSGTPPTDGEGHGTHTSSTAAGGFVPGAAALGQAKGTAIGIAPLAHLAMYKVCDDFGCSDSDILAGMDAAIEDGVDVLSLSLGGGSSPFYADSIAIGAFAAVQKGILVSCSAGNEGPDYETLSNEAPWILTVGASTVDRKIKAVAKLGNGQQFSGESLFQPQDFSSQLLPLFYPSQDGDQDAALCGPGSLDGLPVKGAVVVCDRGGGIARIAKGQEVKDAGGAAMILANDADSGFTTLADAHTLPATNLDYISGVTIKSYINSTDTPTATILFQGTSIGDPYAPSVASFSSRGPSLESPGVLKPDILGPGVSILAAWPFDLENATEPAKSSFNVISGTSMSCPHLSGIAALLKRSHPDWSPAAIKSAIMTTADSINLGGAPIVDETMTKADIFATGAGHVNPTKANDPGLVYDATTDDYIPYLCGLGYDDSDISIIVQKTVTCAGVHNISQSELNYPTFSVILGNETVSYTRTVTNVGPAVAAYDVRVSALKGAEVIVSPSTIHFVTEGQTATYSVTFVPLGAPPKDVPFSQGYVRWVSDKHTVNSPVTVIFDD